MGLDNVSIAMPGISEWTSGRSPRTSGLPEENTSGVTSDWDAQCVHVVGQRSRSLQQVSILDVPCVALELYHTSIREIIESIDPNK